MKILIFVRSLHVGGTEHQVVALSRGLVTRGHDIVIVQLYSGGAMEMPLKNTAVRLLSINKLSRWDVFGPLKRLHSLFHAEMPDVIYSFLPVQNILASVLRPKRSKLVFGVRATAMEFQHYDRLSNLSYRLEAALSGSPDAIIANSISFRVEAAERGFRTGGIIVVPNGIDTDMLCIDPEGRKRVRQEWNLDDKAFVVGMVARLDPMKDHANFLTAAALFAKTNADARFVCVGGPMGGHYYDALRQMAHDLGIAERLSFTGEQRDLVGIYNAFDIATLSSAFGEGFPNVIGEAMACGVPVVATDVGDAREIVGDVGAIVAPRRADLLSEAWTALRRRMTDEPGLLTQARARIIDRYRAAAMVRSTERVLELVLRGVSAESLAGAAPTNGVDNSGLDSVS